jgi:hypothetical protein
MANEGRQDIVKLTDRFFSVQTLIRNVFNERVITVPLSIGRWSCLGGGVYRRLKLGMLSNSSQLNIITRTISYDERLVTEDEWCVFVN